MADDIMIRSVEATDAEKGLFRVLAQLTSAPPIPREKFAKLVEEEQQHGMRHTVVAVDANGDVIATGAVFFERKFIRAGAMCAHIEDIVVDEGSRGKSLGKKIIESLVKISKDAGCYKIILDCADANVPFYEKCGFVPKERQMTMYF